MTVAVVTLAIAVAALVTLAGVLAWRLIKSFNEHQLDRDLLLGEQRRGDELQQRERDQAGRVAELETINDELERRLALAEDARNAAAVKAADASSEAIRNAPSGADALDEFNRRLQDQLLPGGDASGTAGADRSRGRR